MSEPQNGSRVPPKDLEAEQAVIGAILFDNAIMDLLVPILSPGDFLTEYGRIYRTATELRNASRLVDATSLHEECKRHSPTDSDFWLRLMTEAMDNVPHAEHAVHHAGIVLEKSHARRLIYALRDGTRELYEDSGSLPSVVTKLEQEIDAQAERRTNGKAVPVNTVLMEVIQELESDKPAGIKTGIREFDNATGGGMKPSQMVTLAARPGVGKSSLMLGIATYVSRTSGPVLIITQEMSRSELVMRMLAALCGSPVDSLEGLIKNDRGRPGFMKAAETISQLPILLDDQPNRKMADLEALARIHKRQGGLSLVCLDYLQLVKADDRRAPQEAQVAQISRDCKMLAKTVGVPVLVLSQLNRAVENRENRRPRLADLRSSGAIEQDSDIVMFLDRPHTWDKSARDDEATLILEKNRNGTTADIALSWHGPTMKFSNPAPPKGTDLLDSL